MLRVKSDKSDWLRVRNEISAHAQEFGPGQMSRFLVLTKRNGASVDENGHDMQGKKSIWRLLRIIVYAMVRTSLQQSYMEDGERSL